MGIGISFKALQPDYRRLWDTMEIRREWLGEAVAVAQSIQKNRQRYQPICVAFGAMPWWFVGVIHVMESGGRWNVHPHNGEDPLTGRTIHAPRGRLPHKDPPYTWEESMFDALDFEGFDEFSNDIWRCIEGILYALEIFNGMGYRRYHPSVKSPYLWSKSNHFSMGKFTSDGIFDPNARSDQIGAAVIIRAGAWTPAS